MNAFEFVTVSSLEQATAQLKQPQVLLKAGGVDVMDRLKEGLDSPKRVVNLNIIQELNYLRDDARDGLRVGALFTLATLESHADVMRRYTALSQAAGHVATPQIRNMATLGGNILQRPRCWYFRSQDFHCRKKGGATCYAQRGENQYHAIFGNFACAIIHPSSMAAPLAAFHAVVKLVGPRGTREVALEQFLTAPERDITRENQLAADEVLTEIHVPAPPEGTRSAFMKLGEKESFDWPLAEVAVVLQMDGKTCKAASVVLGAAAPVPYRATQCEAALVGKVLDENAATVAAQRAVQGATPLDKNGYKVKVFEAVVRRAILAAAGGGA